jgi:hypothetical protein
MAMKKRERERKRESERKARKGLTDAIIARQKQLFVRNTQSNFDKGESTGNQKRNQESKARSLTGRVLCP